MVDIVPARPEMIEQIAAQPAQQAIGTELTAATLKRLLAIGHGFAAVDGDRIHIIAGAYEMWRDRAVAWALLSHSIGPAMPAVHRAVSRWFEVAPWPRIEAHVDPDHEAAGRWAAMLGFEREGRMRKFFNGRDFDLWARTK